MKKTGFIICAVLFCLNAFCEDNGVQVRGFTAAISNEIPMLHPHVSFNADEAQILSALYEGLFVYDPYTLQPVPALAEKWTNSEGRVWHFTVREDARFENGDPITAKTFADSWLNLLSPEAGFKYASLFDFIDGAADYRKGKLKNPSQVGIKADSERELTVYTSVQAEHIPAVLCHHAFSAVHPSQLKTAQVLLKAGEIKNTKKAFIPVASGAFKIDAFTRDALIMSKNEQYWDKSSVEVSKLTLLLHLSADEAAAKFNKGEIDWLSRSDVILKIAERRNIHADPMFATEFFFFKTSAGLSKYKEIRKALLLAVPYKELRSGYLIKASTLVFPLTGYPDLKVTEEYNVQKAQELINSFKLTEKQKKLTVKIPDVQYYKEQTAILTSAWEKIGITCEVKTFPFASYYSELEQTDYEVGVTSWIGDFADPLAFLELFRADAPLNYSDWSNRDYEQAIKKAAADEQIGSRYEKLGAAERILLKDSVILPLSHQVSINIIDLFSVGGWYPNAINIHPFKFIKFVKPEPIPGIVKK